MDILELENKVQAIRNKPLKLVCMMPTGRICTATVRQCWEAGARFIHVDCDEIDKVLGASMGGDNDAIAENRRKP